MKETLWYLLAGTSGGPNRARLIHLLSERPRNANELADRLGVHYNTVRHHLEVLADHGVVVPGDEEYAELYFLTDRFEHHRDEFERITETVADLPSPEESTVRADEPVEEGSASGRHASLN